MKKIQKHFPDFILRLLKLFLIMSCFNATSQLIDVEISARIDTSKIEIKKVYHLYKNYINSRPDSIYNNPYWSENENNFYLKSKLLRVDRSANQIYSYYNAIDYLNYYKPTILQIDSIDVGRYQVKTLFMANCPDSEYKKHNPSYLTKLYAVKDSKGDFKLENSINYDTKNWQKIKYKFITYYIHPSCKFNKKEAKEAVQFCESTAEKLKISIEPFTYYVLPNSDELGKLYNFEYWLYYLGGQTNIPLREIFTTYSNLNYPHEFVHMLLPLPKEAEKFCPMIINEGIATWLAGPGFGQTFEEALLETSTLLSKKGEVSLYDIISFKVRNEFDNTFLYVTGGVICKLIYEKKGADGILEIYNSTNDNFKNILEKLFEMKYEKISEMIIDYIKSSNQ